MVCLESERLILREWKQEDLTVFVRMNQDPEVMEFFLKPLTEKESRDFYDRIQKEIEEYGYGLFAVEEKKTKQFIGYIGLHHTHFEVDFCPCLEIGWRLCRHVWGAGYATEGAKACLDYAFNTLQMSAVYSFTSLPNFRSERVMQKIGMQKLKEFNHPLVPSGHPLHRHVLYKSENISSRLPK